MLESAYFIILPGLAIVSSVTLLCVLGRPRFTPTSGKRGNASVSIIIPARNEAENIATLLQSVTAQTRPALETIVVNDGSTDDTAAIAEKLGAKVIHATPPPDGWKGKPWACQQGAEYATGEWLLFLDADLFLQPNFLEKLQHLTSNKDQVISICPYHTVRKPYEQLSAFFNLLMAAGVNAFGTGSSSGQHAALFGQSLFISRACHQKINGHHLVKDQVLENFHLASHLEQQDIIRQCYLGKGALNMRMFPGGFQELWSSWKKGFVTGASNAHSRALTFSSIWISGAMLAMVCAALAFLPSASTTFLITTAIAYLIYVIQCMLVFKMLGSFSLLTALFFPVSLMFYQILFFSALIDRSRGKQTEWKGRLVD